MIAVHLTFSTYGFWLPNDPRGSGSRKIRAQHLYEVGGEATKVNTTRSVAARVHDHRLRLATKQALKRPAVVLTGLQARAVARGVACICPILGVSIYAFSIMPDHIHVVANCAQLTPDELLACLKRAGTKGLNAEQLHPFAQSPRGNGKLPSPWAAGGWKVYLDRVEDVRRAIQYVEQNPIRAGLKPQSWWFVTPFDG